MLKRRFWLLSIFALTLLSSALALAACSPAKEAEKVETYKVSLLIQTAKDDVKWFRDVEVPKGTDAFELTEKATKGNLRAKWYPEFRTHFLESILGVENKNPNFWLIWLWSDSEKKWEPLPVGADLFSLKDGHVLAWLYADTSKEPSAPPSVNP